MPCTSDRDGENQDLAGAIVTNDVSFGPEGRIIILTGPNQGGKTTYIQGIGLTQVMAQAGLHVPGKNARISPVDGLYSHFPTEEKLEQATGRFGDEANACKEIFTRITRHSLMLLNESLSSTSAGESLYLGQDIVRILRLLGVRAIFSTHLHELAAGVDELNASERGDSRIISMVASPVHEGVDGPVQNRFHIVPGPPMGRSYAREIAGRYGVSYEQLRTLLDQRGVLGDSERDVAKSIKQRMIKMGLDRMKLVVGKRWLLLLAGVTWMAVSVLLAGFAYSWLRPLPWINALPLALSGLAIAIAAYRLGFVTLALKNIQRIQRMSDRASLFAFLQWKSYLMIAIMASGGAMLRHSAFPKPYLAVIYLGMGGSLFLSSLHYYPRAWPPF